MNLTIRATPTPLRQDEFGVVRVGDSQVLLDVVIRAFNQGSRPEEIAQAYSTLKLGDVYAVITHYLHHRAEVDEYLLGRRDAAAKLRQEIEAARPSEPDLRTKLVSRRSQMEQGHASAGE